MKKQSGSGLIFAVMLLFVILAIVVTLSSITVLETKMGQKTKSSVGAFFSAESGVEWALNQISSGSGKIADVFPKFSENKTSCPAGFSCVVYFLDSDGKVIADPNADISQVRAVRSVGTESGETQRAIEAAVAEDALDSIPPGGIILWSGKLADIPSGWHLCDGEDGTPNLRNKFVYGAGNGIDPGSSSGRIIQQDRVPLTSPGETLHMATSPSAYYEIAYIIKL